jgi:hypothetical protein
MERQDPEMYLLRDFEKAEIKGETLTARFKGGQKATIRLQLYSPALLKEVKDYIEEAAEEFHVKATSDPKEIKELIEVGFQCVCEKDGLMFFRKRK